MKCVENKSKKKTKVEENVLTTQKQQNDFVLKAMK